MTTEERTRRALEKARENDSNNRDATRRVTSSVISSGSDATKSRTERALQSARQKDRESRRLTPSRELGSDTASGGSLLDGLINSRPAGGSVSGTVSSALNRFSDRGVIDTFSDPDKWDTASEAEAGMQRWSGELASMEQQLTEQADALTNMEAQLQRLQQTAGSQDDIEEYNRLYGDYESGREEYNALAENYNRTRDRYASGLQRYQDILGSGMDGANQYTSEADMLEARNAELDRKIQRYELGVPNFRDNYAGASAIERLNELKAERDENQRRIALLRAEAEDARMEYYSSLRMAEDWEENSAPLGSQRAAQLSAGETPYYAGGVVYDYINDIGGARGSLNGYDDTGTQYAAYGTMTPDETGIYNYLYATQGREAAEQFLSTIRETLNYRLGAQNYENMSGLGKALYWIPAGLSQFSSGIEQLFSREAVPTSPTLYTSSMIQQEAQERSPVWGTLYELSTTLSNMAPSVLASALGGWALGGTGMAAGTAARVAGAGGSALLGASAGGNAYTQALNEGYEPDEARTYATLVGASEGALQYLLGGIQSLGGAGVRTVASKIGALDNALGRIARTSGGRLIGSMISEGTEEGIQELLEPAFRTLIFDEEYDANFSDAAYSFLLGALSAGIIEGPGAARESIQRRRQPQAPDFSAMEGYIGTDGEDHFQGIRTLDELDNRYRELAEDENAESLDWENISHQYTMARDYLRGAELANGTAQQPATSDDGSNTSGTAPVDGIVLPETRDESVTLPTAEDIERRQRMASASTDLERSGISAGVSEENIAAAQRISDALGRQVRFYDGGTESGPAQAANGYYLEGTIYVNSRSANPVVQIIAHELTHSVEMADAYSELSSLVLEHMQQDGGDLQQLRQAKRDLYARNGVRLADDAAIDQELVAEYIEKNLLTDEDSILALTRQNRSLGERILAWLNGLLARLGNASARERAYVTEVRDAYSRALTETATPEQTQTLAAQETAPVPESSAQRADESEADTEEQPEPPSRAALRQLREDYAAGRISEEEFDAALDAIEEQETLEGQSAFDELRYSIDNLHEMVNKLTGLVTENAADTQRTETERTTTLRDSSGLTISSRRLLRDGSTETISSGADAVNAEGALSGEAEGMDNEARYSIDENYERDIDDWDSRGRPDGEVFILGETGDVLQGLGAVEQDIYMNSSKANEIMKKHPEMTLNEIKRIPEVLDDPILVLASRNVGRERANTRLVMFGSVTAQNGRPVMAVLDLRPYEGRMLVNDMQRVTSAYTKDNDPVGFITNSEALYADEKRAAALLRRVGFQTPTGLLRNGYMGSISYGRDGVNIEGIPFDEVVSTEDTPQYSISQQRERSEILSQLRRYVNGDISTSEIRAYIDGVDDASTAEADEAASIVNTAHAEGLSVDEYLRQNWETYEYDGELNETARRALELEREQARRRYSVSDPERVIIAPGGETVIENPTESEYRAMNNEAYQDFPWLWNTGETAVNMRQEPDARYIWSKSDGDAFPLYAQYSVDEETVLPTAAQSEYDEFYNRLPAKAKASMRRAENALLTGLGKVLSVPNAERHSELRDVVHDMELEYLNRGTVSQEVRDELFARAYDAGVVIDREFYDQYKGVRDYLRKTDIDAGPEVQADIADFNDFRTSMLGRMNIRTRHGTNIDQVYQELNEMWPELFPEDVIVPSDQLLKMAEVAQSVEIVRRSLDEFAGSNAGMFREAARREFDSMVAELVGELRDVQRYMYDRENPDAVNAGIPVPQSAEEAAALWQQVKPLRRAYERTLARTLLTRSDEQKVNDLMRGQMNLENLNPETDNVAGITAVYQAKQAYEAVIKPLRIWNQQRKAQLRERADQLLENANDWKDKRAGIMYSRETMERNIRDIVTDPNDAEALISEYFTPVHEATANATRMKNSYRDRVRALDLSRRVADGNIVSEAHAVQLLGEAEDNIRMMEQSKGRIKARDGKSLSDWRGIVQNLWAENPNLDEGKIRGAVNEFRAIYDELFQQMNDVRVRNGYEPINYRSGYFPHFQPGEGDGILSQFGRVLGIDTQVTALPTTINGLTHTFRPGITWFGNAQERIGFNTVYDAVEGFDKYIEGVSDVITQTDNIQRLRALASQIRYRTSDDGIRAQIDAVNANPDIAEEDKQNRLEKIYEKGRYTLSHFVVELEEYTNLLANKKSRHDRNSETDWSRDVYNFTRAVGSRVAANMVAINPASWLTNFVPLTQGWAGIGSGDMLKGMWQTLKSIKEDDGIISKSVFLTNRQGSDPIVKAYEQGPEPENSRQRVTKTARVAFGRIGDTLSSPMEYIDQFVAGSLVRARYNQNLGKGMSEAAAMADADAFTANVMADRSKGAMPTLFNRRGAAWRAFTQFQLEVNNQLSYIFKDVPREVRGQGVKALAAALIKFTLGAWLFDELYEWLIGRRPALDPIGIINDTVGDLTGWEVPNLITLGIGAASGNVPSFETEQTGVGEAGKNLVLQIAEELPFIGSLLGGGRLPIFNSFPDIGNAWQAMTNTDWSTEYRLQELGNEISPLLTYLALPFGGGQLNRIYDTIRAISEGGVYTYNNEGERLLQYPVYTDTAGQAIGNALAAGIFGTTSLQTGRDWVESGFPTLTAEQTAVYQGMLDAGVSGENAYELIQDIRSVESAEGKRYVIQQADISGDGKSVAYYGLFANDKEKSLMDDMAETGADMGEVTDALIGIKQASTLKGAQETEYKLRAIIESGLTDDEKMQIYRGVISDKQDEDILAFLDAGLSFDQYMQAKQQYAAFDENIEDSNERAVEFAAWVDDQDFTAEQAAVVQETIAPLRGDIGKFTEAGMDLDTAVEAADTLDNLGEEATATEEYMAIARSPLSESDKRLALEAIMSDSAYEKYERARSAGIDTYDYCTFLDTIADYTGDGRQEMVWSYIDSMPLTSAQKDALHLAAGYKESTLSKTPWH